MTAAIVNVVVALGGWSILVVGLSAWLGKVWAERIRTREESEMRQRVESTLRRLDASLEHTNFVRQRIADFELVYLRKCWTAARRCHLLMNAIRPEDGGTDLERLNTKVAKLRVVHDRLLRSYAEAEPFLPQEIMDVLGALRIVVVKEIARAPRSPFTEHWWADGVKMRQDCEDVMFKLRSLTRERLALLQADEKRELER